MRKAAVIAYSKELAQYMKKSLEPFFHNQVTFKAYTTKDIEKLDVVPEKIVIISAYVIFKSVENKLSPDAILQVFSLSLSTDNLKNLEKIKNKERVLLVSIDYYNCMQTITQIYEAGCQNIDFVPYSGDEDNRDKSIDFAITPGEVTLVPKDIKNVVDIGPRIVDINCVIELADKLGIKDVFSSKKAREARSRMVFGPNGGLDNILAEAESVNDKIRALIEHMDNGVMISDISGKIYMANAKAKEIVGIGDALEGFSIQDIIPSIDLRGEHDKDHEMILKALGKTILASNSAMFSKGKKSGNIITIKNFEEVEKRQYVVRNKLSGKSHTAKNNFSDIVGSSEIIKARIESAKRMANSNASVLITGPSGSGKEIFAQSIHNASSRSPYNFVALNCAAIPEALLESELFGYEPGAFTGAKKDGKIGFFELAHNGTIFLDEIGEMSLALQSKLLRVIEERDLSRIGSSKLIHVDIRIIAATNQNLEEQVEKKLFREDLFYRLNVLPLTLPPIREREHDSIELLYAFRDRNNWAWQLDDNVEEFLLEYSWPGNVREIRNLAEYLGNQDSALITMEKLPSYMSQQFSPATNSQKQTSDGLSTASDGVSYLSKSDNLKFILQEGQNLALHSSILTILSQSSEQAKHMGRLQIMSELIKSAMPYSEAEVRSSLRKLSEAGYIKSKRGSGGSYILKEGKKLLKELNMLL